MIDNLDKSQMLSVWGNLKKEREMAVTNGMSSVQKKEVLLVDGY